jgi:ABC-type uncharacterized transport system auxiliary subunit
MMRRTLAPLPLLAAATLAACGTTPVPDIAFYRMPEPAVANAMPEPAFQMPIVVDTFVADGLHGQQAILYASKPGASVRAYHYQLWNDPPPRLLQRRLVRQLRAAQVSPIVVDRLSSRTAAVRVLGVIERFERVDTGAGWEAQVAVEMRADVGDQPLPALLERYEASAMADSDSIQATVRAFAAALDQVFAEFTADLARVQP